VIEISVDFDYGSADPDAETGGRLWLRFLAQTLVTLASYGNSRKSVRSSMYTAGLSADRSGQDRAAEREDSIWRYRSGLERFNYNM
jgi:hypothetical protein